MTEHRAFFGDSEKIFAFPTRELIEELEQKTGQPIGGLFRRFQNHDFSFSDLTEIIRLGLIGGGTSPADADRLVKVYSIGRPLTESFLVALGIITALFLGVEDDPDDDDFGFPQDEKHQAAATGDLAAAITAAYRDVAE
ncbi:gene transfer agent family protein [Rhizobium lentis]|uniref:Gene transfer agent family protein n=1 Tax=Rhizobium lentis TaxID=1138194 RepID=A0A9Q3QWV2_9HYPH|nr:gene transfer agent family protein [Rhizobium lentis]MBX5023058.1 gene transfer agent family protein [Rhizobium lentis]MBX5048121.1 gene transfer agent family protein [Rhizobium lentis]MBX5059638.1 gene transfer agent family protein [Rhizobium lentis]